VYNSLLMEMPRNTLLLILDKAIEEIVSSKQRCALIWDFSGIKTVPVSGQSGPIVSCITRNPAFIGVYDHFVSRVHLLDDINQFVVVV